ncbi:MAG: DUF58 domain-containing protein [Planctomycetes bacterium]|nr:DUF58 domain-containing protein [Planctomycetota bacterium]
MPSGLFDDEFRRQVAHVAWVAGRLRLAGGAGERAGARRGGRVEFVGHHRYAPGDEFRYVDWNAYARTGRLFVKEFAAEEGLRLELALDATGSMARGDPPKFTLARRVAAALVCLLLEAGGSVRLRWLRDGAWGEAPTYDRVQQVPAAFRFLELAPAPTGGAALARGLEAAAAGLSHGAALLLVSDLLDPAFPPARLAGLTRCSGSLHVLHLLAREDEEPPHEDRALLQDVETGAVRAVALDDDRREAYRRAAFDFCEEWRRACDAHGAAYLLSSSERRMDEVVLALLDRGRLLAPLAR